MVEVTIYFHHGGEWLTSPEPHYDRGCVTYWKGYDPDLISFIDIVNEYINKLGFVGVQELIVLAPSDYDTDELENFVTKKKRNITESLQYYKEIVKGMAFKDIAQAKQFCKLYALAKKVELVVVKSDKKRLRSTCVVDGYPVLLLISRDLTTPGVSVKTLVDHIECGTTYDNSLVDYSTIALYFKDKLQSDPKYKVKEIKADLHRVFELNVSEAKCKRAKKEILESLEGSFVDSYNKLVGYATELRSCNPGSDILIDLSKEHYLMSLFRYSVQNQVVDNNFTESFNAWILEARYKPIIGMLEDIRIKIMERLAAKEVAVRKWKDDGFSPKSELLFIEYLKISKVCKVSGNGDNGYEFTEGTDRHIVNLREKKCTCRTWDLTGIPCPHAIKAMEHKKMIPKKEIHWYYSKEAALAVCKHKLQPVRGEPFWKYDPLHAIEPPELVKLVGRPKLMREREKDEAVKRQGVWKQTRKGKVMTYEASEEDINCIAPQPTQESQFEYASSSSYFPIAEDDDEDPRRTPRTISEKAFLTRLKKKQNPQEPIQSRVIGFKGDKFGVSEPTNLPIRPTGLTWNGQGAVTTNQLQKLRPRRG
ncbi:hypothetical protein RDI58_014679 [Solanum bulbocastanum]|uniref:SWIM-type domain-containing protein n=1 Tax=Solanum bulbocastanum TaxID=147425 RepID=A0AAN8TGE3_SOLBU